MTLPEIKRHRAQPKWILSLISDTHHSYSLKQWIQLVQQIEQLKIHSLVLEDSLDASGTIPRLSPTEYISALASATKSLGFVVTASTISEHPYLFTRRFASLDHLSKGRAGWSVDTSSPLTAVENLRAGETPRDLSMSEEYLKVVTELMLSSWRDDALVADAEREVWIETDKLRQIDFEGRHFIVPGPSLVEPTIQRLPLICSPVGTDEIFAAKYSEIVYVEGSTPENIKKQVQAVKSLAEKFGRDSSSIKFVALVAPIIGATHEESGSRQQQFNKTREHSIKFVGTAEKVADDLEKWFNLAEIDGFGFRHVVTDPDYTKDTLQLLIQELQKRGVAQREYTVFGGSLRENVNFKQGQVFLHADHPLYKYRWTNNLSQEQFERQIEVLHKTDIAV